eukprot:TRINITY_DN76300_c0_g1_i1.p1 TRINITY_DN76300_c0_g1~~TRINITY_DN76300_c0_g1_i1.p1  ORF type:complete len:135 (+),score=56.16 TRINITY_DN76300_c0_g1_i1:50-454(+)
MLSLIRPAMKKLISGAARPVLASRQFGVINFTDLNGETEEFEIDEDAEHLQELADMNDVELGVCDGEKICGRCHITMSDEWFKKLGDIAPIEEEEQETLDGIVNLTATSRLSCGIAMSEDLDGLEVTQVKFVKA